MFAFLFFVVIPFIIAGLAGVRYAFTIAGVIIGISIILALGFVFGLTLTFFFLPDAGAYFKAYKFPSLWSAELIDSLGGKTPMYTILMIPSAFFADLYKIYFHFSFTNGNIFLWIPELMSWSIIYNLFKIVWLAQMTAVKKEMFNL
jgi:hypothetical protein